MSIRVGFSNHVPGTTKKFLAAASLVLAFGGLGLTAGAGTAAADGLDATPMPPAVIDEDGFHNYFDLKNPRLG